MSVIGYQIVGGVLVGVGESASDLVVGELLPAEDPQVIALRSADAVRRIDLDVDAIYRSVIGNRTVEYTEAEADARAFAAAGFAGDAPESVYVYASTAGLTDRAAAESIIAQADAWRASVMQIRSARLAAKAKARSGAVDEALADWAAASAAIRSALGV